MSQDHTSSFQMASLTCSALFRCTLLIGLVSACAMSSTSTTISSQLTEHAIENARFSEQAIKTASFELASLRRIEQPGAPIRIYIEGDGKAWLSRHRVSANPTPDHAVGLHLALADDSANVIYVARPCQFVQLSRQPRCSPEVWTRDRYSANTVTMYVAVLAAISSQYDNASLELIGFSGGATIAMLAAPRLRGLISIRTVAGNLDTEEFSRVHKLPIVADTANPATNSAQLETIPQIHFVGTRDILVPPRIARSYISQLKSSRCARIVALDNAHHQGWNALWPALLRQSPCCYTASQPKTST